MKKLDFLPNRRNKYSIRKFTVGTASILLGTMLILGVNDEARAAENSTSDSSGSSSSSSSGSGDTSTTDSTTETTPTQETQTNTTETTMNTTETTPQVDTATPQEPTQNTTETTETPATSTSSGETSAPTTDTAPAPDTTTEQEPAPANQESSTQTPSETPAPLQPSSSESPQTESTPDTETTPSTDAPAPSKDTSSDSQTTPSNDTSNSDTSAPDSSSGTTDAPSTTDSNTTNSTATDTSTPNSTTDTTISSIESPTPTLSQDLSQTLDSSADKESALTDYLATEENLSPEAAQQVVDGMAVDANTATDEEIADALLTSYLLNTSSAPGSDPVGELPLTTSTQSSTTSSSTSISPMFRMMAFSAYAAPAPATQVSTWDQFIAALNDKTVSNIQLTGNITGTSTPTLQTSTGRSVTIDGGGYTLNTGTNIINAPATSGSWNMTYQNMNITTGNTGGLVNFGASTTTNNTISFNNVKHTGSNLVSSTLTNQNVTVNISGNFSSISNDSAINRSNIGAKNINIASDATVNITRTGLGNALQVVDGGVITTGTNSNITMNVSPTNPWGTTNGTTAFQVGNGGSVLIGDGSTLNITGQNIFDFANDGTLYTGANSTINISQKGNGNIVDMGTGSTFEVGQYSKFIAYSDGHRVGDYSNNNIIGLDGNSQILIDEYATLFLDAKNHQWNPDTKTQVGAYNDLVNINATGTQSALLWVKDNATLDLRTDNRDYYAEVLSIPLGGTSQNRQFIFDNANYINFQKNSIVTSGQSVNGSKPNLIYMDPNSPGYMQWNGSYIVKTWNATHFSDPNQSADADTVWSDVVDLQAAQKGFSTGTPTYNTAESTSASSTPSGTSSKDLSTLNLNTIQRIVLISNNSVNPEAVPAQTTVETIEPSTSYQAVSDPTQPLGNETIVVEGVPGSQTVTTEPGKDTIVNVTQQPTNEVVGVNNVQATTTTIPYSTQYVGVNQPTDYTNVRTQGQAGSTTTTTTYTVDPATGQLSNPVTTTSTVQPVTQVIEKGTVQVTTEDIAYNTVYVENPDLPQGTQNVVQQGVTGQTQTTTTYTVNQTTGALESPTTSTTTLTQKQDQIIEVGSGVTTSTTSPIPSGTTYVANPDSDAGVGDQTVVTQGQDGVATTVKETGQEAVTTTTTQPVDEVISVDNVDTNVTPIAYNTVYRYNPDLAVGTPNTLVQDGQNGSTTTTTTYDVDATTGALSNPQTVTNTINPVDQVYEYGPVAGDTVYQADPNQPAGQTTTVPGTPGDPNDPNNLPTDTIVYVGNVSTSTTPIIHSTEYIGVNEPTTYRNVVAEGSDGSTTTTTTYEVNPETGELINPQTNTETVPAENRVIEKGTVQVTTAEVPYETVYRENPDLPQGTENVLQEGVVGQTQTTTTYTINRSTGELENPVSNTDTLVQEQDRIIEVGTGTTSVTTTPIPATTVYQANPDKDSGTGDQIVVVEGQDGVATTVKEPGQEAVTTTTTPAINEVIGVDNVDSATAPIPYETITRYNPTLPVGSQNVVVQEGQDGTATTIKTYEVDPTTGALSNPVTTEEVSPATPRIVEYGPVAGNTVYQVDPNLPYNQTNTVPGTPGNPNDPNNLPTDTIVYVGNVNTTNETLPYDTQYVGVNQPVDYTNVQTTGQTGLTTTTTTYEVDPNTGTLINPSISTQTTQPVTEVVERGTVQVATTPVQYDTIYQENADLPVGIQNEIQPGVIGETTTTTTYTVNPETGALENPSSTDATTIQKQDRIIEVGTGTTVVTTDSIAPTTVYEANPNPDAGTGDYTVITPGQAGETTTTKEPGQDPVTEITTQPVNEVIGVDNVDTTTETIPYQTETRYNPNLPVGSTDVVAQQGQDGVTTTTTTYDVNTTTGQLSNPQVSTTTTQPVTQIIEYGPVAGETIYQADPNLPYNETTTIEGIPGDPNDPNNLPTNTIINVGNTTHELAALPYDTQYVGVSQPVDYTNVRTEGQEGSTATTTTYTVDPYTGALSDPVTSVQTVGPITQVVEKGTIQTTTADVPYETIYRENPDLPQGTQNVVQQGVVGQTQTTTTYTVNPETGALESPTSDTMTTIYKQDQIIEVGTGVTTSTTSPILPTTTYQANPDADPGTGDQVILVPGQEGVATTVKEPGQEAVTTTTYQVDPNTGTLSNPVSAVQTIAPVTQVVEKGTVRTTTEDVAYNTIYVENADLPQGTQNEIQTGITGQTQTTTTYTVNAQTGALENPVDNTTTLVEKQDRIIEVGTGVTTSTTTPIPPDTTYQANPDNDPGVGDQTIITQGQSGVSTTVKEPGQEAVTTTTTEPVTQVIGVDNVDVVQQDIPYNTVERYNPNLPVGTTNSVAQEGQNGLTTTTTTYEVDPDTGALLNPAINTTETAPVDRIVEYGPVAGEVIYQPDPSLPVGQQTTTEGVPGDPNDPNNLPTDTVVKVGNVDTATTILPHDVTYVAVAQPTDYKNVATTGIDGSTTTTTTYQVDPNTGVLSNPTSVNQTTEPVTEVVEIGTQQVTTAEVPYTTIYRENPDLAEGTQNELQAGVIGQTQTTTTYSVNPETGELYNPVVNTVTLTDKQDRIVEVGTGVTVTDTTVIPPTTTYEAAPNPDAGVGNTTVITEGVPGESTTTKAPGQPAVTETTTPPVNEVIGVDNVDTTTETIPFDTQYVAVDQPIGYENVATSGQNGTTTTTTTYQVDPNTGALIYPETTTATEQPVAQVIEIGTKQVTTNDVPFNTTYVDNPNLPVGTENEVQPGIVGQEEITTTYTVNPTTGALENPVSVTTTQVEKQDRIIERGTGVTTTEVTELPPKTIYVADSDNDAGVGGTTVLTPGQAGSTTTTTEPGQTPVTETIPAVDQVVGVDNVDTSTSDVPFETQYVGVNQPVGYENIATTGQNGTETTTTTYDVNPETGELTNPQVTTTSTPATAQVVEIGTTKVETNEVNYETIYRENPDLPAGTQNEIQAGITGQTQTTTTYTVNAQTGALENPTSNTVTTQEVQNRIIEVGTGVTTQTTTPIAPTTSYTANPDTAQPIAEQTVITEGVPGESTTTKAPGQPAVTETTTQPVNEVIGVNNVTQTETDIPYETIIRYNPNLPVGTTDYVAQTGQNGSTVSTTTYEVDPNTGALSNPTTQTTTINPVNQIVEYGPVAGDTIYQADPTLPAGQTSTVPGQAGDPNDPNNLPTDTVVKVGNVTTETSPVPYNTQYVGVSEPTTYTNVQTPGQDGTETTTTTYTVNPETGALESPVITTTTTPSTTEVIEKGTVQVVNTDIPYDTVYRENPDLPEGTQNELQAGIIGTSQTTTTYQVNGQTGALENPTSETTILSGAQTRIIEVGVGTTVTTTDVIEPKTNYVANPDADPGTGDQTVITPGEPGESTTTKAPGQEPVTETTTPAVDEVIGVDNVDTTTQTIPYETIIRYNPDLPVGTVNQVVQEGQDGTTTTTTTYDVDSTTGTLSNPQVTENTTAPVNKIVEYGPVEGTIVYQPDANLPYGETETIPGTPGDPNDMNNLPTETVVKVGNQVTTTDALPYETQYIPTTEPVGYENVKVAGQDGTSTTTTVYDVDPTTGALSNPVVTTNTTPAVTQVVEKGTTQVTTSDVPYETVYVENPNLPEGAQNVLQEGSVGQTQTTTVYTLNAETGALENPVSSTVTTQEAINRIIEVGTGVTTTTTTPIAPTTSYEANPDYTQPVGTQTVTVPGQAGESTTTKAPGQEAVTETTIPAVNEIIGVNNVERTETTIPYETIVRYNPSLPVGTTNYVAQEGTNGTTTTTTTYEVDNQTGALTNPQTQMTTVDAVNRIVEYGPVEGGIIYQPDTTLPAGQTSTTPGTPGDPNDPDNLPTDTVVKVGNTTTETTQVPYETKYVGVDAPTTYTNVQTPGQTGTETITTTYSVNPSTGALSNPQITTTSTPAVDEVIEKGTTQVTTADVPYNVVYQENPNLPQGTENVLQEGIAGQTQTTVTYTVNPQTGELENPLSTDQVLVEKQDLIIEVGVGTTSTTTTEIPPETTYVANPDPDAGTGDTQVVTPGVPGESTTTKAPGQEAVTEITTPAVNEVIGVDNVDTTTQTIPYETIIRCNPDLPVGTTDYVAQEGQEGTTTTTTTYEVDSQTGALMNPQTETQTTNPVQRIVEYGPVEGGVVYQPDSSVPYGETVTVPGTPGDPNDPNNPPTETVVKVGNMTTDTTPVAYDTQYVPTSQPVGYENITTPGQDGVVTTTTIYQVDPSTGTLINPEVTSIKTPPVTQIVEKGTTQTSTNDVPYETVYIENPNLPQGTQNELQAGVTGQTTTTVTYTLNPQTGALENPTEVTTTDIAKQDRIIEVGSGTTTSTTTPIAPQTSYEANPDVSQPIGTQTVITEGQPGESTTTKEPGQEAVTEVTTPAVNEVIGVNNVEETTETIPYDTIVRYNTNLPVGTTDHVAQVGQNGTTTTTTTYEVDTQTGTLINPTTTTETTNPVQRIVEYGPAEGQVVYQPDPTLPAGETRTVEGQPGDPNDPDNPPTNTVVYVGNVATDSTSVPYDTQYISSDEPIGYESVVTPGQNGTTTTTTTYEVDPTTGALINPTTTTDTTAPTPQIVAKGTTQTTTNDVPFETIYQENPNLPQGTQNEVQAGITGQTETTTTYTINPETGALENPSTVTTTVTPVQNRVIEIGVGTTATTTTEIPPSTSYEANPNPSQPIGTQTVTTEGQPGIETTTKVPGQPATSEITTPPVNEVVGVNNVEQTTTPIPYETIIRYNPDLPIGTVNHVAQEGQNGITTTTTTYEVDKTTGALLNPTTTEYVTTPPVDRIIEYGPVAPSTTYRPNPDLPVGETQVIEEGTPGDPNDPNNLPKDRVISVGTKVVTTTDIPYDTIYQDNPNLPAGTEYEVQPGKTGQTQTTTVYGVDPKTGELINPDTTTITLTEKVDRIVERGTGTVPVDPEDPGTTPEEPEQPEDPGTTPEEPEQPEDPGTPDPEVPQEPENPEKPTPEVPETPETPEQPENPTQPGTPEVPETEVPNELTQPEQPTMPSTPETPEQPTTPSQPTQPEVTVPSEEKDGVTQPNVPSVNEDKDGTTVTTEGKQEVPPKSDAEGKQSTKADKTQTAKDKDLPDTGQDDVKKTLFGTLFAGLGAWLLFGKRRKKDNEEK